MPSFTDAHGVEISYEVWPAAKPHAVVQLVHGLGEYAARYAALAARLNAAGYSVYADDHRGHGQTGLAQGGGPAGLGKLGPGGVRAAIDEVEQFTGVVREAAPGLPFVLLAHSWGSLMAQVLINRHADAYDAAVLAGSAYRMPGSMAAGRFNQRWKSPTANGFEWLSRDPAAQEAFAADPLTFYADTVKVFGFPDGLRLFGRPARELGRDLPLYIVGGSEDSVGGDASMRKLAEAYRSRSGLTDVTLRVYPDARHAIFDETNGDAVIDDMIGWLDGHFPPVQPGVA
jgi:alpha-beta hydrolase superfamily lysophospholipase